MFHAVGNFQLEESKFAIHFVRHLNGRPNFKIQKIFKNKTKDPKNIHLTRIMKIWLEHTILFEAIDKLPYLQYFRATAQDLSQQPKYDARRKTA